METKYKTVGKSIILGPYLHEKVVGYKPIMGIGCTAWSNRLISASLQRVTIRARIP